MRWTKRWTVGGSRSNSWCCMNLWWELAWNFSAIPKASSRDGSSSSSARRRTAIFREQWSPYSSLFAGRRPSPRGWRLPMSSWSPGVRRLRRSSGRICRGSPGRTGCVRWRSFHAPEFVTRSILAGFCALLGRPSPRQSVSARVLQSSGVARGAVCSAFLLE